VYFGLSSARDTLRSRYQAFRSVAVAPIISSELRHIQNSIAVVWR